MRKEWIELAAAFTALLAVAIGLVGDRLNRNKNRESQALERSATANERAADALERINQCYASTLGVEFRKGQYPCGYSVAHPLPLGKR